MKQSELARRMGVSEKYVIDLLGGNAPLSSETALRLERVLNVPARLWTNLELGYRDFLAREKEAMSLKKSISWSRRFPLREMAKLGWLERARDQLTNTHRLLTYFGCASEEQWHSVFNQTKVVYRHSAVQESDHFALMAWLRRGAIEAHDLELPRHEANLWSNALITIRRNISSDPDQFSRLMIGECTKAGVGLIFLPSLPKMAVSGACVWINKNPCIFLSLRYKTDDHLWFSFFHEAKHVFQNVRKRLFVDEPRQAVRDPLEIEANRYAADTLIPEEAYKKFVAARYFDEASIKAFAREHHLTAGVIVGRLQHDNCVPWPTHLNSLKMHYRWKTG